MWWKLCMLATGYALSSVINRFVRSTQEEPPVPKLTMVRVEEEEEDQPAQEVDQTAVTMIQTMEELLEAEMAKYLLQKKDLSLLELLILLERYDMLVWSDGEHINVETDDDESDIPEVIIKALEAHQEALLARLKRFKPAKVE